MIIVLLAEGFEEIEALTPVDMLRRAGLTVKTVGISNITVTGAHGIGVVSDLSPEDVDLTAVDTVILPGGMPGTLNLDAHPFTDKAINAVLEKGGRIAAICAAPIILGRRGLLDGRKATCYPGFENELTGALVTDAGVVTDGNITTARGMGVAIEFAEELISLLTGKKKAAEISAAICKEQNCNSEASSEYIFPSLDLLSQYGKSERESDEEINLIINTVKDIFSENGISAEVENPTLGPRTVTLEIIPERGVKINKILNVIDDIQLYLARGNIRAVAPIPGRSAIGFEIPRRRGDIVGLRPLLESEEFKSAKSKTTVCLGHDSYGNPLIVDLARMPHLLIGGATGMGKSVCLGSIISSLMYKATPDEVKLILIDPKQVEFTNYRDIPHLLHPIIDDPKKATAILKWAMMEMDRRYSRLEALSVRSIDAYNEKIASSPALGKPMEKIVIVIDELADLMLQVRKPLEEFVTCLAQKSRAAGIYMIIATQRPTASVISGLIKANIPSRICFRVMSGVDSNTVLDSRGGEKLLDRGDALYSGLGDIKPRRIQSAFICDSEVMDVAKEVKEKNGSAAYDEEIIKFVNFAAEKLFVPKRASAAKKADDGETSEADENTELYDKQFLETVDVALNEGKISTYLIQRKLNIGYGKAAKYIDMMEEMGIVSPMDGLKPRTVLISKEEWLKKSKHRKT